MRHTGNNDLTKDVFRLSDFLSKYWFAIFPALLALDAVAPVLGAASTLLFSAPPGLLALFLGFFAGFLLYISTSDILPEAHSAKRPAAALVLMGLTCLGAAFIFVAVRAAG